MHPHNLSEAATAPAPSPAEALLALRARAGRGRHLVEQATGPGLPQEAQQQLRELAEYQQALETQCEALLLAQAAAETAHREYVDHYELAPVGYFTLSAGGVIEQLNPCGSQQLGTGRERLAGRRFALFVHPAGRDDFGRFLAQVLATDDTVSRELVLQREDGSSFFAQLEGRRGGGPPPPVAPYRCRLVVVDSTARRRATDELAASEARFRKLFAQSNDAVVLLHGAVYVDCNAAALCLLGATHREQVVGRTAWSLAPARQPDERSTIDVFRETVAAALATGSQRCEARMHRFTGEEIWVEAVLTPIEEVGGVPLVHVLWRDVTAARLAADQLRREKEFTQSLLENSVDGLVALDRAGRVTAWNSQAARYFGHAAGAVLGQPAVAVLPYFDTEAGRQVVARVLAGEQVRLEGQAFAHRAGHFDVYHVPLREDDAAVPTGVLLMFRDVTERDRLAEEATRLRLRQQQEVLAAILDTQETERKRIAEALHNGLGQLLYATKLSLEGRPATAPEPLRLLEEAIKATRTISFELTPGILEDFGLRIALEELTKRIAPTGLPVRLHLTGLDHRLRPPVEITVYRVVQELLNNVLKHAAATEAIVHVAREHGRVEVSVEDNGRGFELAALATRPLAGIGLAGARNRVALLGGALAITSRLGRGTIISFELDE